MEIEGLEEIASFWGWWRMENEEANEKGLKDLQYNMDNIRKMVTYKSHYL